MQHGKTGLIVPDRPGAWFEALNQLVTNPHLRQAIQRDAYQDVDARYRQEFAEQQWIEILSKFAPRTSQYAGVSLAQARQELMDRAEKVFTRLTDVNRRNQLAEIQLAQIQGELDLQLPLARNLANELEAYRGRKSLRLVEGLRDRIDYADRLGPNFMRLLDDSRLFGLAKKGYRLRPSLNLSRLACLCYRLAVPRTGLYCVQFAFLLDLYPRKGYLRLELASPNVGVMAKKEIPADTLQSERPVAFAFNPLRVAGVFELRLFAHDLDVPLRVYEWQRPVLKGLAKTRTRPFCALDFDSPA